MEHRAKTMLCTLLAGEHYAGDVPACLYYTQSAELVLFRGVEMKSVLLL